jgi:two-component system sensor histidine kinase KdpD
VSRSTSDTDDLVRRQAVSFALAACAIVLVTATFRLWLDLTNTTIAALTYLLVVLITATASTVWVALATSALADLCLNYFFMPPFGTFTIADPQNWVALFAFLAVSVIASSLSSTARDRAQEAMARRDELARLFDLSRDVLLTTDSREAITQLARFVSRRFELPFAAICLPRSTDWDVFEAGTLELTLDPHQLSMALAGADQALEFDARSRTYAGHRTMTIDGHSVRLVPLRLGTKAVGLLAAAGRTVESGTLDALAGVAAIAIERAQFLEERKAAELARQSEALKSALLASLSHDLRTPLTAIRVAASNLQAAWLADADRREQSDLILAEVERLSRLFQNILEMARLDAGAVAPEVRWVSPSEIVEAARDQVEHALRQHDLDVASESDMLVRLDPRLTASALAHLLENAAQYSPPGSAIDLEAAVSPEGLAIKVRDRGPGIAPADLPHVFDRFYRGTEASRRASGTGMGLSIARGMLAAERGRIWAENRPDGGAEFTIVVPADSKPATLAGQV